MPDIQELKPTKQACRNCNAEMPYHAFFYLDCGQRNTDGRITFGQLAAQFQSNLLNFDGRIFQGRLVILMDNF